VGYGDWPRASNDPSPEAHTYHVLSVAVLADGRHIVSGSRDKTFGVWELGMAGYWVPPSKATPPPLTLLQSPQMAIALCLARMTRPSGCGTCRLARQWGTLSEGIPDLFSPSQSRLMAKWIVSGSSDQDHPGVGYRIFQPAPPFHSARNTSLI